jgi:hypothetical protein
MDVLESLGFSDFLFYCYTLACCRRWNTLFHNREDVSTKKSGHPSLKKRTQFICCVMFLKYVTLINRTLIVTIPLSYLSRHESYFFISIKIGLFWNYFFQKLNRDYRICGILFIILKYDILWTSSNQSNPLHPILSL